MMLSPSCFNAFRIKSLHGYPARGSECLQLPFKALAQIELVGP